MKSYSEYLNEFNQTQARIAGTAMGLAGTENIYIDPTVRSKLQPAIVALAKSLMADDEAKAAETGQGMDYNQAKQKALSSIVQIATAMAATGKTSGNVSAGMMRSGLTDLSRQSAPQ